MLCIHFLFMRYLVPIQRYFPVHTIAIMSVLEGGSRQRGSLGAILPRYATDFIYCILWTKWCIRGTLFTINKLVKNNKRSIVVSTACRIVNYYLVLCNRVCVSAVSRASSLFQLTDWDTYISVCTTSWKSFVVCTFYCFISSSATGFQVT